MIGKQVLKHSMTKVERPYVITPYDFQPRREVTTLIRSIRPADAVNFLQGYTNATSAPFAAPVHLPHNAHVTGLYLNAYTLGAGDIVQLTLAHMDKELNAYAAMATCNHDAVGARSTITDFTITAPLIDLNTYYYYAYLLLTNAADAANALIYSAWIDWY